MMPVKLYLQSVAANCLLEIFFLVVTNYTSDLTFKLKGYVTSGMMKVV